MDNNTNKINTNNKLKFRISTIFRSSCSDRSLSDTTATTTKIPNTNLKTKPPTHPFPSIRKPNSPMLIKPDPARQKLSESYSLFYSAHSAPLLEKQSMEKTRKKKKNIKPGRSRRRRSKSKINNVDNWLSSEEEEEADDALLITSRRLRRRRRTGMKKVHHHYNDNNEMEDSYAVVKCSKDPYMDFRTSMVEMIVEKRMRNAEDLERLLQCFLKLNSYRHHHVIIEAFMDIWDTLFIL